MPRKTKDEKELEEKVTKKATATTKKVTAKKKTTTTKKTTTAKNATATKKTSNTKKTESAKKRATTTKKTTTTKKASSTKKSVASKATRTSTTKTTRATKTSRARASKAKKVEVAEYYDLPFRYNQTVVKLLAQTPTSLFVYWEISDDDIENYKLQYGENFFETTRPVLVVHNETMNYSFEVEINDYANSWYLTVNDADCDYRIELGRRRYDEYIYVTTSNDIESPNDHILLERFPKQIKFKNVKNGDEYFKKISSLKNLDKIYDIYELYKLIYQDENLDELNNSSSNMTSSGVLSSSHS